MNSSPTLVSALTRLVRTADGGSPVAHVLSEVCRTARTLGVDGADIMVIDHSRLRLAHADPYTLVPLGNLQERSQRGTCCDCVTNHEPVTVADLGGLQGWPEMASVAGTAGLASVLSIPLICQGRPWGALDLYRRTAFPWPVGDMAWALLLASIAANHLAAAAGGLAARGHQRHMEHLATHDVLTGLSTRAVVLDRLEHVLRRAERHDQKVAVLFVDVDDFKEINDAQGHGVGDEVLVEVARRLERVMRRSDSLGRWSGDEFVAVCEGVAGGGEDLTIQAASLSERIHSEMGRTIAVAGVTQRLSVSVGIVVVGGDHSPGFRAQDVIAAADRRMYAAKNGGGGRTSIVTMGS